MPDVTSKISLLLLLLLSAASVAASAHAQFDVYGAIGAKWHELGAENGTLGRPTSDEFEAWGGRVRYFEGGAITWHPRTGAQRIYGGFLEHWQRDFAIGWPEFPISFPSEPAPYFPAGEEYTTGALPPGVSPFGACPAGSRSQLFYYLGSDEGFFTLCWKGAVWNPDPSRIVPNPS